MTIRAIKATCMTPFLLLTPDKVRTPIAAISRYPLRIDGTKSHRRRHR
jgi:hypothetical protein